jgi:hypothetical protein
VSMSNSNNSNSNSASASAVSFSANLAAPLPRSVSPAPAAYPVGGGSDTALAFDSNHHSLSTGAASGVASPATSLASSTPLSSSSPPSSSDLAPELPVWFPDERSEHCLGCRARFTLLNRKHHCRRCGLLLCAACTPARRRIRGFGGSQQPNGSQHPGGSQHGPVGVFATALSGLTNGGNSSESVAEQPVRVCVDCARFLEDENREFEVRDLDSGRVFSVFAVAQGIAPQDARASK